MSNRQKQPIYTRIQAGRVLHRGYVPENHHKNGVRNPHLKQCISWILGGLTTSSYVVCDYTSSGCRDLWNIYVLYTQDINISVQYIYLYLM
jgi:hypothetical protein